MVRLRLKRFGRRHRPYYRLCAMDQRAARDSTAIEQLGYYHPLEKDPQRATSFNSERVRYWLSVGAQPSRTVSSLLRKAGIIEGRAASSEQLPASEESDSEKVPQ